MVSQTFVRASSDALEWALFDARGQLTDHVTGDEAELGALLGEGNDGDLIWVLAGEDVLLTTANVPSRQYRQIVQAVPYAVEEQLATDVESCFFALGERGTDGTIAVAVIATEHMVAARQRANEFAPRLKSVLPDSALVPFSGGVEVVVDGDRAHLRWSKFEAMTVSLADVPLTLSLIAYEGEINITVQSSEMASIERAVSELEAAGEQVQINKINQAPFVYLACGYSDQINLLQGAFKVDQRRSGKPRIWRSVAVLAFCALVLHLGLTIGEGWYLANRASSYEDQSRALYQEIFPSDRNVRDLRRRWNTHLGKTSEDGGAFIAAFAQSARGLGSAGLSLTNVNFNESRGDLILQVSGPRSESLVQYAQQLSTQGLKAEIGTINQEGNTVKGSIKIKVSG